MFRQGDLLLVKVDRVRGYEEAVEGNRVVLALGEVTGHAHVLEAPRIRAFNHHGMRFLQVEGEGRVVHEEHAGIAIPAGAYFVVTQREYIPQSTRSVED